MKVPVKYCSRWTSAVAGGGLAWVRIREYRRALPEIVSGGGYIIEVWLGPPPPLHPSLWLPPLFFSG